MNPYTVLGVDRVKLGAVVEMKNVKAPPAVLRVNLTVNARDWGSCVDLRVRACRPTPWAVVLTLFPSVARVVMGPTDAR